MRFAESGFSSCRYRPRPRTRTRPRRRCPFLDFEDEDEDEYEDDEARLILRKIVEFSYEHRLWTQAASLIVEETS